MSFDDIEPLDWPIQLFGKSRSTIGFFDDMFRGFDEMWCEMEREFEDMEKWTCEDFIREYTTPKRRKVIEVRPIVYRYSSGEVAV